MIYDIRVGAALGLLLSYYLEDNNIALFPEELRFSYGNTRPTKSDKESINKRNPSSHRSKFTLLDNNWKKHIKNNIYANWLLAEIVRKTKFRLKKSD